MTAHSCAWHQSLRNRQNLQDKQTLEILLNWHTINLSLAGSPKVAAAANLEDESFFNRALACAALFWSSQRCKWSRTLKIIWAHMLVVSAIAKTIRHSNNNLYPSNFHGELLTDGYIGQDKGAKSFMALQQFVFVGTTHLLIPCWPLEWHSAS